MVVVLHGQGAGVAFVSKHIGALGIGVLATSDCQGGLRDD
jgi:hypothetical protein